MSRTPPADDTSLILARLLLDESGADIITLARTIYGEARGETREGREMVANVVMNRVAVARRHRAAKGSRYWWGETVSEVCLKPWQFSCWNENDPNRPKLLATTVADPVFRDCIEIARAAVQGSLADLTGGADHYLNVSLVLKIGGQLPPWATDHTKVTVVHDRHTFYRLT